MPRDTSDSHAGPATVSSSWRCPHCGSPQVVGARVCLDCGCVPSDEMRGVVTFVPLAVAALVMLSVFAAIWLMDA